MLSNQEKDVLSHAICPLNLDPEVLGQFKLPKDISIYDSTLRDGEQMPGVSFTDEQKLCIARKLDEIGIPEIEAGFPVVSKNELKAVQAISREGLDARILVLSRLRKLDIDAAIDSEADVILLFIASSPLHLQYKLHITPAELKQRVIESIDYAQDHGVTVSFSTEDSTRTPLSFLEELVCLAAKQGVQRIGFTDTVGCATPQAIQFLYNRMSQLVSLPFSAHLHNDFGLALVNALTALNAGARYVCTTVNGWGERAGNVPLEQLVMAIQTLYGRDLGIDTTGFSALSQMVADFSGLPGPRLQPFVGSQVFTHESGIHVAAMLENPRTYEAVSPALVGNTRHLVIGKHTGRHIIKWKLQQQGIEVSTGMLDRIITEVKSRGERNGALSDEELSSIALTVKQGGRL